MSGKWVFGLALLVAIVVGVLSGLGVVPSTPSSSSIAPKPKTAP